MCHGEGQVHFHSVSVSSAMVRVVRLRADLRARVPASSAESNACHWYVAKGDRDHKSCNSSHEPEQALPTTPLKACRAAR